MANIGSSTQPQTLAITGTDTTVTIFNVSVPSANTEVSQALPSNTKRFILRVRGNAKLQLAYTVTDSGTLFVTVPGKASYEDENFYTSQTLFFQTNLSSQTVEIIAYV